MLCSFRSVSILHTRHSEVPSLRHANSSHWQSPEIFNEETWLDWRPQFLFYKSVFPVFLLCSTFLFRVVWLNAIFFFKSCNYNEVCGLKLHLHVVLHFSECMWHLTDLYYMFMYITLRGIYRVQSELNVSMTYDFISKDSYRGNDYIRKNRHPIFVICF